MINIEIIKDLFRHMEWADSTVWAAIGKLPDETNDDKLLKYLSHLHSVQHAFLKIWRGVSLEGQFPEFSDRLSLMNWAKSYYAESGPHLDLIKNDDLSKIVNLPWSNMIEERLGFPPKATTMGETAFQVLLHSMYHRGQVNARLREIGGEPPLVDYIAWLWQGRPAAEWP